MHHHSLAGLVLVGWLRTMADGAGQSLHQQSSTLWLRARYAVDVNDGALSHNVLIGIRGDRIVRVVTGATSDSGPVLPSDSVIDLGAATLLPGMIDTHVHLTLSGPGNAPARATLLAGFTTVQDLGSVGFANLALRDAVSAGRVDGPRILAAGPWIGATGGTCDFNGIGFRGADALRRRVRELAGRGVDLIKLCITGWPPTAVAFPDSVELVPAEIDAAVAEARRHGLRVAAHAIGQKGISQALRAGVDMIVHAGFIDSSSRAVLQARGVFVIPTLASLMQTQTPAHSALLAHTHDLLAASVPLAFGTDAGVIPHGRNADELIWLVRAGMTPASALRSATIDAARALGWDDRLGTLEPGKLADIIAVPDNPLTDVAALQRVIFVMRDGKVYRRP